MHDWVALTSGEIPSPELVAAWVTLGMVPTERIPLWAAHWLVDGYDGQAVRALAGFSGTDPYEVHDTLPDALADCRTPIPDSDSAAAQTAFTKLARMHADGAAGEKWIIDKVDEILARTGYASSVISLPLGQLYGLDEEWGKAGAEPHNNSRQRSNAHAPLNSRHARLPPRSCSNQMKPHARRELAPGVTVRHRSTKSEPAPKLAEAVRAANVSRACVDLATADGQATSRLTRTSLTRPT
ncbi:hypothetical protein GCM10029964_084440 [Kibdelosporangium lantanae]